MYAGVIEREKGRMNPSVSGCRQAIAMLSGLMALKWVVAAAYLFAY